MNLALEHWTQKNIEEFQYYLFGFSKGAEKGLWEKRIINTALPCIAVPSLVVKRIVNEIYKGNFLEFIKLWPWENWTNTAIIGGLICKIKDFDCLSELLDIFVQKADNWATIDCLKLPINKHNVARYLEISNVYSKNKNTFVRRMSLIILLKSLNFVKNTSLVFSVIATFKNETEYYVNMANAWLVAECFTKFREDTIKFLDSDKLNKFTLNKAISKCRDSYRITKDDKEMLLKYRKK